jgi:hypothetical protein
MPRTIKIFTTGRSGLECREVTPEEAESVLAAVRSDKLGGLVYNNKTGEPLFNITPDVEEILIINQAFGGG